MDEFASAVESASVVMKSLSEIDEEHLVICFYWEQHNSFCFAR